MTDSIAPRSHASDIEDITFEVFNHCAGSCTGCLITPSERKSVTPVLSVRDFAKGCAALAEYGACIGMRYRVLLGYGDVLWLPLKTLAAYFEEAAKRGLGIGATFTLVEPDKEAHYIDAIRLMQDINPEAIFDITVDPVRMEGDPKYARRIANALALAKGEYFLNLLLSEAVLARFTPESLASLWDRYLPGQPVILGLAPTLENIDKHNYAYDVGTASDFADAFYAVHAPSARQVEIDLERFQSQGDFATFVRQRFHIGPGLNVYPVGYTMFGEVTLDHRNGCPSLGSLRKTALADIVTGAEARKLSVLNAAWMRRGNFACRSCPKLDGCTFNGVGLVRQVYRDYENRSGACAGPEGRKPQ
jgi:hypothetical protein